uniref:Mucin-1 n=1 Tax=Ornithorhynchus anatinus TaxID=9258 RepID=A0A6I8NSZ2_ORNAN
MPGGGEDRARVPICLRPVRARWRWTRTWSSAWAGPRPKRSGGSFPRTTTGRSSAWRSRGSTVSDGPRPRPAPLPPLPPGGFVLRGHVVGEGGKEREVAQAWNIHGPGPAGASVPGWGIALLVLISFLVLLALLHLVWLVTAWFRRRRGGHFDLFSSRDTYHPMSEYPAYHTHGSYLAPGTVPRPHGEVSSGNGGGLSFTNPAVNSDGL